MGEHKNRRLLIVDHDPEYAFEYAGYLKDLYQVKIARKGHLQGITLFDEFKPDLILVTAEGTDLDGLEFCKLIRRRQQDALLEYIYLILLVESEHWDRALNCYEIDDFISRPFIFSEMRWRIVQGFKRLEAYRQLNHFLLKDPGNKLLKEDELFSYLEKEINRSARRNGFISFLKLYLYGLENTRINYGDDWTNWMENYLLETIYLFLRNYDKLIKVEEGLFCLIAPDTNFEGMQGLVNRLKKEFINLHQNHQDLRQEDILYSYQGLTLKIDLKFDPQRDSLSKVWEWIFLREEILPNQTELCKGQLKQNLLELEICLE